MDHWAARYIGKPHRRGAVGPEEFDCLSFVTMVYRDHYDIRMSVMDLVEKDWNQTGFSIHSLEERKWWKSSPRPEDGDLVLMMRAPVPVHVGIHIAANGGTGVLHCAEKIGVVFQSSSSLLRMGWSNLNYYRHVSRL